MDVDRAARPSRSRSSRATSRRTSSSIRSSAGRPSSSTPDSSAKAAGASSCSPRARSRCSRTKCRKACSRRCWTRWRRATATCSPACSPCRRRSTPGGAPRFYNSVVSVGVARPQLYRKRHLVPFGETIPLEPVVGWFIRKVLSIPIASQASGDPNPPVLEVAGQRVAVNICYEDAFGADIRGQAADATLLVNVTNDAWYGRSLAALQHNQIAAMRALETGRPLAPRDQHGHHVGDRPRRARDRAAALVHARHPRSRDHRPAGSDAVCPVRRRAARRDRAGAPRRRDRARPAGVANGGLNRRFAPGFRPAAQLTDPQLTDLPVKCPLRDASPPRCSPSSRSSRTSRTSGASRAARCCSPTTWRSARARRTRRRSCARSGRSRGAPRTCSRRAARRTAATAKTRTGCSTTISTRSC